LPLSLAVSNSNLATMTDPYFKLCWLPAQHADQQSRMKNLFTAAARDVSAALPNAAVKLTMKTLMIIFHSLTLLTLKDSVSSIRYNKHDRSLIVTWKCFSF